MRAGDATMGQAQSNRVGGARQARERHSEHRELSEVNLDRFRRRARRNMMLIYRTAWTMVQAIARGRDRGTK